jgi:hypothetical protein
MLIEAPHGFRHTIIDIGPGVIEFRCQPGRGLRNAISEEKNMAQSKAEERIMDGSMWDDFCDRLKAAGKLVTTSDSPDDVMNRALGYRLLTRLLRGGLESCVDYANPQYPDFFRLADETKGVLNNNPDNHYQNCVVNGRLDYRITGKQGTVSWFSIGSKANPGGEVAGMVSTGEIDSRNMTFNDDGTFEILVSAKEQQGNWLRMTEDTRMLIVRQTFGDRSQEEITTLSIECLNPEQPNNNLDPEALERQLGGALTFMESTTGLAVNWMARYKRQWINALPEDDQPLCHAAGGDPSIHYYQSYYDLQADEALLVHLNNIPECETWNLQISNYWMECMEYRFFDAAFNKFTAKYEDDGSVYIVVSHQNPGPRYPNWLDTHEINPGGMLGRYVGSTNPPKEMPSQIVKIANLQKQG